MKKIPTLFVRNFEQQGNIINVVKSECQWVTKGLGVPTYKYDGTAVLHRSGIWYARRTVKDVTSNDYHEYMIRSSHYGFKNFPAAFRLEGYDQNTQKAFGWVPAGGSDIERPLAEAIQNYAGACPGGTYELIGPKVNGNKHGLRSHRLEAHGQPIREHVPTDFDGLYEFLKDFQYEGVVWWRVDGQRAKIKRRDFHLDW